MTPTPIPACSEQADKPAIQSGNPPPARLFAWRFKTPREPNPRAWMVDMTTGAADFDLESVEYVQADELDLLRARVAELEATKEHAAPIDEANRRDTSAQEKAAWAAAESALALPESPAVAQPAAQQPAMAMTPMDFEDGRRGYYIDHPSFYCDIEPDESGVWSVYFRDKTAERDVFAQQPGEAQEPGERLRAAVGYAENTAMGAVSHVGAANYAEREREAKSWVREAFERVYAALAAPPARQQEAPRDDGMPQSSTERRLRRMLCAAHCGATAYMDDGEASDCSFGPPIDFMRESLDSIEWALLERGRARLAQELAAPPQQEGPSSTDVALSPRWCCTRSCSCAPGECAEKAELLSIRAALMRDAQAGANSQQEARDEALTDEQCEAIYLALDAWADSDSLPTLVSDGFRRAAFAVIRNAVRAALTPPASEHGR